jgi:hypothetical protein
MGSRSSSDERLRRGRAEVEGDEAARCHRHQSQEARATAGRTDKWRAPQGGRPPSDQG